MSNEKKPNVKANKAAAAAAALKDAPAEAAVTAKSADKPEVDSEHPVVTNTWSEKRELIVNGLPLAHGESCVVPGFNLDRTIVQKWLELGMISVG